MARDSEASPRGEELTYSRLRIWCPFRLVGLAPAKGRDGAPGVQDALALAPEASRVGQSRQVVATQPPRSRRARATASTASSAPDRGPRRHSRSKGSVTGGSSGTKAEPSSSAANAVRG